MNEDHFLNDIGITAKKMQEFHHEAMVLEVMNRSFDERCAIMKKQGCLTPEHSLIREAAYQRLKVKTAVQDLNIWLTTVGLGKIEYEPKI